MLLHLLICRNCKHCVKEFEKLNQLSKEALSKKNSGVDTTELENKIINDLKKHL